MSKRVTWEPVPNGEYRVNPAYQSYVLTVDDNELDATWPNASHDHEIHTGDLRLCRQVESDAVSVPIEVRDKIILMINGIMDSVDMDAAAETAAWEVQAWLDQLEAEALAAWNRRTPAAQPSRIICAACNDYLDVAEPSYCNICYDVMESAAQMQQPDYNMGATYTRDGDVVTVDMPPPD